MTRLIAVPEYYVRNDLGDDLALGLKPRVTSVNIDFLTPRRASDKIKDQTAYLPK